MGAFAISAVSTEKSQSSSAGLLSEKENNGSTLANSTNSAKRLKETNVFDPNVANLAYTSSPFTNIFGSQGTSASAIRGHHEDPAV